MTSQLPQTSAGERKRRHPASQLPLIVPGCSVALHAVNLGKFENSPHLLAERTHWNELKQMLQPVAGRVVEDALGQYVVDSVRRRFDPVTVHDPPVDKSEFPFITEIMRRELSGNEEILKMLLAVGMDPDIPGFRDSRPSHWCGLLARLDLARLIFPCRPSMTAKCGLGLTPLQSAETCNPLVDTPRRRALRGDVWNYIKNGGFETGFPTLPELAVRRSWFAIKNLLRRGVVAESEFTEKVEGKTAAEWAKADGEIGVAQEISYYGMTLSARFELTAKQMTGITKQLIAMGKAFSATKDREFANSSELKRMKLEAKEKDAKIEELSAVVAVYRSRLKEAGIGCDVETSFSPRHDSVRVGSSIDEGCDVDSVSASSSSES